MTDHEGKLKEHLEYFPFGETWVEEESHLPIAFQFTAKELDHETGLYYFGACREQSWRKVTKCLTIEAKLITKSDWQMAVQMTQRQMVNYYVILVMVKKHDKKIQKHRTKTEWNPIQKD